MAIAETGLVVAVAGGAGAFLGATVGQAIQWVRELQAEKRVDRRREEDTAHQAARERRDRRFDEYLLIQSFLQEYADRLHHLDMMAWGWSRDVDERHPGLKEVVREALDKVEDLVMRDLSTATARAHVVGSDELRTMMTDLTAASVGYATNMFTTSVNSIPEGGIEDFQRRHRAGEKVDLSDYIVETEVAWTDVANGLHEMARRTLKDIAPIQQVIRKELDLA